MPALACSRRHFLATAGAAAAAFATHPVFAATPAPTRWPIGCFNRPWTKWSYDIALAMIKAAGYPITGLLSPMPATGDVFTGSAATPAYLTALKQRIAARGLKVNMTALRVRVRGELADAIADARRQLEHAHAVGVEFALTFGVGQPKDYEFYFKVMADAAAFAQERGIKVVLKPHGGGSGASEEIRHALRAVGHPNFKIWYDAGNIIYYTGKDPVKELEPIAEHVTGFCAKDCAAQKGDVMIQFGEGKVDFTGVFRKLKSAGFHGPIMVECCRIGATPEETMENAKANRVFLEKALAAV